MMKKEAPFGYEWKDGELVINEKNAGIIKWLYKMVLEYMDNPPDYLIKETMDNSKEKLSYDEAREKISFSKVQLYVLAELKVRVKQFEDQQVASNEIQKFLEVQLDKELIAVVEEKYRFQRAVEYAEGFISPYEMKQYAGKVKPLTEFEQNSHDPLVPRELYENAVKKIQENRKHTSAKEQSDQLKQDYFFERLDALLPLVDLHKLDESCNSADDSYAKEILKHMHDIFVDVYGTDYLENRSYEFVEIPAVVQGRKTGHIGLGIVQLDLESSGEHWGTYFLTPRGVIERHQEDIFKDDYNYVMETYIPYDYWYTVTIERDIHVDFDNVPEKINSMLNACYPNQPEMRME